MAEKDYISREAAKLSLRMNEHRFTCADEANGFGSVKWSEDVVYAEAAQKAIDTIPAADVRENVKARWIDMGDHLLCSGCGATHYGADKNFCPNCGADMRKEIEHD